MSDTVNALQRCARLRGWTARPANSIGYYNLRFTRPEPEGRESQLLIRVTHRIVDVQIEIGGLRQQLTMPTRSRVEEILATPVPQPVHRHPASSSDGHDLTALQGAVDNWNTGLDHHGHALARAANDLLRRVKGNEENGDSDSDTGDHADGSRDSGAR